MNQQPTTRQSGTRSPPEAEQVPLVGIDTGGTFTDLVALINDQLRHCKVLSTPDDPSRAMVAGLEKLGLLRQPVQMIHGSTVGTNAVLEGKGVPVIYITSTGFADVLSLGRQNRRAVYELAQPALTPPVPAEQCLEVATRCDAQGNLLQRADDAELQRLGQAVEALGVESVAINLLFSFLCPEEEARIAAALPAACFISMSSAVLPEIREYERGMATFLNASIGPLMGRYLERLQTRVPEARIAVMQSSGTTIAAAQAAQHSVRLLLSGPAGGIAAARLLGQVTGDEKMLTLDMGGTSTDVALLNGDIPLTQSARIAGWPLSVSTVDLHTIGAGGGSIAMVDEGGALLVGPESAGARPGPACYGQGGHDATVTDANLVLGRIPPDTRLGGYMALDQCAAESALDNLAGRLSLSRIEAARGVIRIANEHMARALRVISLERGYDPAEYALVCFGGAGGLHACDLAELLGISRVVIPARGGVLSAHGMLASEPGRDLSRALLQLLEATKPEDLAEIFLDLEAQAEEQLGAEGARDLTHSRFVELRYLGQSATLQLPSDELEPLALEDAFHRAHEDASGHRLPLPVELVNLRLRSRGTAPLSELSTVAQQAQPMAPVSFEAPGEGEVFLLQREELTPGTRLQGPLVVRETAATCWVARGWCLSMDEWGNLQLQQNSQAGLRGFDTP